MVREDHKTTRLRAAVAAAGGTWRDVASLSEPELAVLIRKDKGALSVWCPRRQNSAA